jgi:hypothetical protein
MSMESLAITSGVEGGGPAETEGAPPIALGLDAAGHERPSRATVVPRSRARPGMSFGHDVLLALIMAVAMAATVFLYR